MAKGKHLLLDCRGVDRAVCLNDKLMLDVMARAAEKAGANVVSQVRYKFGQDSPPGFTAFVLLDESHCSAHTYADLGLVALDIFTCGNTNPRDVANYILQEINLGEYTIREVERFHEPFPTMLANANGGAHGNGNGNGSRHFELANQTAVS